MRKRLFTGAGAKYLVHVSHQQRTEKWKNIKKFLLICRYAFVSIGKQVQQGTQSQVSKQMPSEQKL